MILPAVPDTHENVLLLFETTHAAMEAEQEILAAGFRCDIVPRPPGVSDSLCGLAIEVGKNDLPDIESLLKSAGITVESYTGGA